MKKNKNEKGFTVIELIVVIGIIAALVGIITFVILQFVDKSKDAAAKMNLSSLLVDSMTQNIDGDYSDMCNDSVYKSIEKVITANEFNFYISSDIASACSTSMNTTSSFSPHTSIGDEEEDISSASTSVNAWAACVILKSDSSHAFCVDSTGVKKIIASGECTSSNMDLSYCP